MGLADTFPTVEAISAGKLSDAWPLFEKIAPLPALVLRGENSDLLSDATVDAMRQRYPALAAVIVKHRAHVPFLDEPEAAEALDGWLAAVDDSKKGQ
jgi:pimeloyl-ACP methyl ester carboxylesterase